MNFLKTLHVCMYMYMCVHICVSILLLLDFCNHWINVSWLSLLRRPWDRLSRKCGRQPIAWGRGCWGNGCKSHDTKLWSEKLLEAPSDAAAVEGLLSLEQGGCAHRVLCCIYWGWAFKLGGKQENLVAVLIHTTHKCNSWRGWSCSHPLFLEAVCLRVGWLDFLSSWWLHLLEHYSSSYMFRYNANIY